MGSKHFWSQHGITIKKDEYPSLYLSEIIDCERVGYLKVQSCKLCNIKYMIASTRITNAEIFAFMAVLVFKLLSRKILFINRKDNRNC